MKGMIVSVLLVAAVAVSEARSGTHFRYVTEGECPTITNKQDFDPVPYLGKWYEIERFNIIFQKGMDCVQAIYSDLGDGVVEVHNVARKADGNFTDIVGTAVVLEPGVLYVTFSGYIPAEYHVLDTDYESFSAVYNCLQLGPERVGLETKTGFPVAQSAERFSVSKRFITFHRITGSQSRDRSELDMLANQETDRRRGSAGHAGQSRTRSPQAWPGRDPPMASAPCSPCAPVIPAVSCGCEAQPQHVGY